MCVILLNMKTVSLRQMQHHLSDALRQVDQGQELLVTRRGRAIARLAPVQPAQGRANWPDFAGRAIRVKGEPLSAAILDERD